MSFLRPIICANYIRSSYNSTSCRYFGNFYPILLCEKANQIQRVSAYSSSTAILDSGNSKGIFTKIFGKFGNSNSRLRATSTLLYENVADKINYYDFFEEFNLPDTFNSWFLVTELHCWLLLTRVMQEGSESGEDGRFLRNCIVEAMWADVQTRSKKLSLENPSASRKQVAMLAEQFQATLLNYDEGLMSDDKILASALWRRFFNMKCDDYTKLEKLVEYVRKTALQLDDITRDQLVSEHQIEWSKIKN